MVGTALSDNVFMQIQIAAGETDDLQFITLLNSLVRGLITEETPQERWIIQIDNWFDHKWLRFSGIGTVDFKFPAFMNPIRRSTGRVLSRQTDVPSVHSKQSLGTVVICASW